MLHKTYLNTRGFYINVHEDEIPLCTLRVFVLKEKKENIEIIWY